MTDYNKKHTKSDIFTLRRRRGAVTLFLCLVIGSAASILLICLQASVLRRDEAELIRAGRAAAESSLAAYDIELLENYGIWAVEKGNISNAACREMLDGRIESAEVTISAAANALDNKVLSEQIAAYMKIRAPAVWLGKLSAALAGLSAPDIGNSSVIEPVRSGSSFTAPKYNSDSKRYIQDISVFSAPLEPKLDMLKDIDMDDIMDFQMKLQEYMFKCIPYNLTLSAINNCLDWIFSPITEPLKDAVAKKVSSSIEKMIEDILPVCPEDFGNENGNFKSGSLPDYFNPDDLAEMAGLADRLLGAPAQADSLVLAEYCLAVFPSQVTRTIDRKTGVSNQVVTPDGRRHDSLVKRTGNYETDSAVIRKNELEMIITGQEDPQRAADRVQGNLMMIRSIIRIIEVASDQEKMNSFRPAANIMSALITAASAGSICIEPETALWLIAVADAVKSAAVDTRQLTDGKSVALWTYNQQSFVYFNYHDYMRLFLLIKPEDQILANIAKTIQLALPGEYVSALETKIVFGNDSCSFVSSYRVNIADGSIDHDQTN